MPLALLLQTFPPLPTDLGPGALAVLIVMFLISPVISLISRVVPPGEWESTIEAILALLACAGAAALVLYANGALTNKDWFLTFLVIFGGAITLYQFFYKPSGIAGALSGKGHSP